MSKIRLYLSQIVNYGLYAILLTPLAFWPKALFPFLTPKFILFQILIEVVFGAWLILRFLKSDFLPSRDLPNSPKSDFKLDFKNWLFLALFGFFTISFIPAFLGIDFSRSFWGIGPRMTGLFAELHFLAWFLVLINISKSDFKNSPKSDFDMVRYLNFSFFVSLVVALTAFYRNSVWGLSFGSTIFNNPTFAAPYLIFHFFWGLYQFSRPRQGFGGQAILKLKGWLFGAGTAFILFAILLGQVRGAILGLFAGILFLLTVLVLSDIFSKRIRILLFTCFLIILTATLGFWQFRDAGFLRVGVLRKFTEISLTNVTVKTRLLAWQVSLLGFLDRPVLGVGPENFNYIFNKHYDPRFLKFGGGGIGETWFDKPHNAFLEILAEAGIIGGLAYVFIWIMVGLALYKLFKKGEKLLSIILFSAFVAYFGAVFFCFYSFGSWFGLYLFLAFLAAPLINANLPIHPNTTNRFVEFGYIRRLGLLVVLIATLFLIYLNYSIWRANIADADALRTFPKDIEQGIVLFKKSLNYFTPYKSEYRLDLFTAIGSALQTNHVLPNPEETINFTLNEADKIIAAHPKDAVYYTNLVKLYDILGEKGRDRQILKIAQSYGEKSLELSPNRQETLFYLTKNFLLLGDTKSAVSYMIKAVNAESYIGLSRWYLGLAYIADNQKEKGIAEIKKAIEMGYRPQNKKEEEFVKQLGL